MVVKFVKLMMAAIMLTAVMASSDDIYKQSAAFRRQQKSYVQDNEKAGSHPIVSQDSAEAAIIDILSQDYSHPVNPFIQRQLSVEYKTCAEALGDIVTWCLILYGDWYGNKAGNVLGFYLYTLGMDKVPRWVAICAPLADE